jgi:cytidine deaminase
MEVRLTAYSPYSDFKVGAAILGEDDKIYIGCNVENISYGLTVCGERSAIFSMVSTSSSRKIKAVAVTTQNGTSPCGIF